MADAETLALPLSCPLVINGEEGKAASGRKFSRENPADFRQVATVAEEGTQEDARAAIDAARTAFDSNAGNWIYNYKLREQALMRTAGLIRANADRLARVVGMITPWNFPLTQTARKVAPALAAGCTIVIKPASYTPAATYELVRLINQTGLPKGVLNLVPGPGNVVGSEIIANKKVDKISFTGETGTGKRIGAQAGMEVKRVSLELGGKAPYLIFDDAEVEAAARAAVFGMFRNAGQACGATTRLLVQEGIHARFLGRVTELTRRIEVGHPSKQSTDMGPLISSNQERVVQDYIKYGRDAGFDLVTGGHKLSGDGYDHGYYVEPTIFDRVDNASKLGQEEIFGRWWP